MYELASYHVQSVLFLVGLACLCSYWIHAWVSIQNTVLYVLADTLSIRGKAWIDWYCVWCHWNRFETEQMVVIQWKPQVMPMVNHYRCTYSWKLVSGQIIRHVYVCIYQLLRERNATPQDIYTDVYCRDIYKGNFIILKTANASISMLLVG